MNRKLLLTKDGSHTIAIEEKNVTYHSTHGAIAESNHVFIQAGLMSIDKDKKPISIFEMGFGTGLNAFLTLLKSRERLEIDYYTSELYPLEEKLWKQLNYAAALQNANADFLFEQLHSCEWNKDCAITPTFTLHKSDSNLIAIDPGRSFDLIYFDAFAPSAQPELWSEEVFTKMFSMLNSSGILVTYCSKGSVRRAMQAAGFLVEKLPGPPGKREIVRAKKI